MTGPALLLDPRGLGETSEVALIGVSGGCDSICLLHALRARGFSRLVVCHLDHGWRPESAAEAEEVARLAVEWGFAAVVERLPSSARQASPENAARAARRAFFARAAAAHGAETLYLAHHADDQVETLLLNLFRGTGPEGLAGMAPASRQVVGDQPLLLRRPLLGVWRQELEAYAAEHGLRFAEDPSNGDPRYTRNRMRHEIIPQLERAFGREVRGAVWRAAELLTAENELASSAPILLELPEELETRVLRALPLALQRRLLHRWLRTRGVENVDFADVENARGLLEANGPAKFNLSGGRHLRRRAGRLFVE